MMKHYRNLFYIGFIILIAYSPVVSFLFALKNDFFTQYFPQRFFIGECVRNGIFPLWNPYINYGIPVFADMNAGFWYPFTWLNAILTGYNAYSFTWEEFLHLLISGTGMYWLTGYWKLSTPARIVAAISYSCSGFMCAHLQHYNWITGAAWLPWCTRSLLEFYQLPDLKKLIPAVLFFSLLLTGSHPGIIIGALYFFGILTLLQLTQQKSPKNWFKPLIFLSLLLPVISGMLVSYGEMMSIFTRANPIGINEIHLNSVHPRSFLSFIYPITSVKSEHDIALQNLYMGLVMLASLVSGLFIFKSLRTKYFFLIGLFFLLISSDLPLSGFLLSKLPLLNYVRLNAEFRIFTILSFLLFAAESFDQFLKNRPVIFTRILFLIGTFSLIGLAMGLYQDAQLLFNKMGSIQSKTDIKTLIDQLQFRETLLIGSAVTLTLCVALLVFNKKKWFLHVAVLDLVIATLLNLPFTGIGMKSTNEIQGLINLSPKGFPKPALKSEMELVANFPNTDKTIGNWSMYSKQIAVKEWFPYPIQLEKSSVYFEKDHDREIQQQKPFVFAISGQHQYSISSFSPTKITIEDSTTLPGALVLKQNYYPGWKIYLDASISKNDLYGPFPVVALEAKKNTVTYRFEKPLVTALFVIFMASIALMVLYLTIASGTSFRNRL